MTLYDHLIVLIFVGVYPAYSFFTYRKAKKNLIANKPGVRISAYWETIAWLWSLGLLALFVWIYNDRALAEMGLHFSLSWSTWLSLLLLAVGILFVILQYRAIRSDVRQKQSLKDKFSKVDASEFLPRNAVEARLFILLSLTAGICEEILFRGFLLWYFSTFGVVLAVVFSSLLFGIAHSYQGWKGGLRAGGVGLIFAISCVLTGSLWVPISLHIWLDIYMGTLGWLAFEQPEQKEPNN